MFNKETMKGKKQVKNKKEVMRKAMGIYSSGFLISTDVVAYFIKRTILILHELLPIVVLHKGVDLLQDTRDTIGKGLSEYAYCHQCAGNGVVFVKSPGDDKMVAEPCPQCNGTGKFGHKLVRDRSDEKLTLKKKQTTILSLFEQNIKPLIAQARLDQEKKYTSCIMCKGKGVIETPDGRQEQCAVCEGTGKDYSRLGLDLKKRYIKDLLEAGHSKESAQIMCSDMYPGLKDKAEIMARLK